jgi:site-specific DNA-methyltransferase (adenine-specific)
MTELKTDAHLLQTTVIASTDLNRIHHLNFLDNNLPDKCANLIIADPPYFEVKGGFDFIWESFEDYLIDVEKWAKECKRLLADNGTLLWWGMDRKIAYSQVIIDKYLELIGTPVWEKPSNPNEWDTRRTFPERAAERLLMYSNDWDVSGLELITEEFIKPKNPFSNYLREEFKKANVTVKEISKLFPSKTGGLTGCVSNWVNGDNVITEEQYLIVKSYLKNEFLRKEYDELRNEYDELRKEYEGLRRPFNNFLNLTDVLRFSRDFTKYEHDTKKPEKLTRALISTCSRENDLVIVPFAGSGTECAMSAKENRNFVGFEITKKHVDMSNKRVRQIYDNPPLFAGL